MSTPSRIPTGSPLATLRRINSNRPTVVPGERCEMCATAILEEHQHVVDLESRSLMCACRACYLLFTDQQAALRYRAVPDRYLSFPGFSFDRSAWDDLQIPVGLVFLFRNSVQQRIVAFYPSPAGATESELSLESWDRIVAANPLLDQLLPDVEALLIYGTERGREEFSCHLVPIDACYELVGTMRKTWRGFDGGQEARAAMDEFFATVEKRSKPARRLVEP
ncbi:MAG TPA: DUF5947 family protein [Nocardioidaceae bacterium]|nr:DUF5947 family protein [Nocardioidaceae bacterium]